MLALQIGFKPIESRVQGVDRAPQRFAIGRRYFVCGLGKARDFDIEARKVDFGAGGKGGARARDGAAQLLKLIFDGRHCHGIDSGSLR
jgi:hypothetical protein